MKVLITGGAGFVGANLCRYLLDHNFSLCILDRLDWGVEAIRGLDVELIEGDIRDPEVARRSVLGCDAVVHLAAQSGVLPSLDDPLEDCDINVRGTLIMLEACRQEQQHRHEKGDAAPLRFVFSSSNAPMGRQPPPVDETKAPLPISPYGASKLAAEGYCLAYHGSFGLQTVVLRFGNVYGPYSGHKNSVVAKFIKDIRSERAITIEGDGNQTRDFLHTLDLCEAIRLALTGSVAGEVFQIAPGKEVSISQIAETLAAICDVNVDLHHGVSRPGDMLKNYALTEKAWRLLGWRATVPLEEGLRELWDWFATAKPSDGHDTAER